MERTQNSENLFVRPHSSISEFVNQFWLQLVSGWLHRNLWCEFNFALYQYSINTSFTLSSNAVLSIFREQRDRLAISSCSGHPGFKSTLGDWLPFRSCCQCLHINAGIVRIRQRPLSFHAVANPLIHHFTNHLTIRHYTKPQTAPWKATNKMCIDSLKTGTLYSSYYIIQNIGRC